MADLLGNPLEHTAGDDDLDRSKLMTLFGVAVAASIILPRIPYGRTILYPFALFGTWAHEMGHGMTALLLGGRFDRLEIYENLGGVAFAGTSSEFRGALVSAGGLLGPAIVGAIVIIAGARKQTAPWILFALAAVAGLSVLAFVRNGFGIVAILAISAALGVIAKFGTQLIRIAMAQLIGIQLAMASWGTLDYMFTKDFQRDGQTLNSDTQNISERLFLPYWFWGGLLFAVSLALLAAAFYVAWIRPLRKAETPAT